MLGLAAPAAGAAEPGLSTDLTWGISESDQSRTAAQVAAGGSKWVRLTINWKDVEPERGRTDEWWIAHHERALAQARAAGQKVLAVFYTSPGWASGRSEENAPPRDPAEYARFVSGIATRFGDRIDAYEVWNEPNFARFWPPAPDPAAYARLLAAAYPALKAADPSAPVLFAGLSTNDHEFLAAAYRAGAKGSFDAMGAHPYSCAKPPDVIERDPSGRIRRDSFLGYRELRKTMEQHGDPKPIWITEFGWSTTTGECGVSEAAQAANIERAYALLCQDPYVEVALYYNLRNNYWQHDEDDIEARYGLTRSDFSEKPAYGAWKRAAAAGCESSRPAPLALTVAPTSGGGLRATGRVAEAGGAAPAALVRIAVAKRKKGRWKTVRRVKAKVRRGRFRKRLGKAGRGKWRVQARVTGRAPVRATRRITLGR